MFHLTKEAIKKANAARKADKEHTILLVDDEEANLRTLVDLLEDDYHLLVANSGYEALDLIKNDPNPERIHLIISDQRMPRMTGVEFLKQTIPIIPKTIRMILTGFIDLDATLSAINEGKIYKFFTKPLEPQDMLITIKRALDVYNLEKKMIQTQKTLEKFVPEQFLKRIVGKGVTEIELGQAKRETITILFTDIRSFTSLSEQTPPQELLSLLNRYFKHMSQSIHQHHGFIDKFIGDAIMALFDRHEKSYLIQVEDAIHAAIDMQKQLVALNRGKEATQPEIRAGNGIHTGEVILGTVGSEDRMDSTVLGDSVNLAARLEKLTKVYGVNIIISENLVRLLENPATFCLRPVDWVLVKGKKDITEIYEVFDHDPDDLKKIKQETALHLLEGLTHRRCQNWRKALESFQAILDQNPQDTVAQFHFQYCLYLKENSPPYDWSGATKPDIDILDVGKEIHQMVEWHSDYAIGIEKIDSQHRELFVRINQLVKAIQQGMIKEGIVDAIQFLKVYVEQHFQEEQEFMKSINYPEYESHLEMHRYFVIVVQQLREDYEYDGISLDLAFKIQNKVIDWVVDHVCKEDSKIAHWHRSQLKENALNSDFNSS